MSPHIQLSPQLRQTRLRHQQRRGRRRKVGCSAGSPITSSTGPTSTHQSNEPCSCCREMGHIVHYCPAPAPQHHRALQPEKLEQGGTGGQGTATQPTHPLYRIFTKVGHTHGLYLLCAINGNPCWALVDMGSTISIVHSAVLPETGWTPTACPS